MKKLKQKKYLFISFILLFASNTAAKNAPWVGTDFQGFNCIGSDTNSWYGPFDFTIPEEKVRLKIVEQHHFNSNVENHIKGQEGYIGGDLNYTLMAGPNHHRALLSIIRLQTKLNKKILVFKDKANLLPTPVECYFQRAINFSPKDAGTYALFGHYHKKIGQLKSAMKYYEKALSIQPNSAKIAYSYSLLLIKLNKFNKALEFAKKAYKNPQTPPGLRRKLRALDQWPSPSGQTTN